MKPVEGLSTKDTKEIHKGVPRRARREKELSTKGHEGPRRGWRRLKRDPPRVAKGRKDFHEKAKRYPRRATKNGEGPRRGWRRLKKDPPKVGQGEKISRKGQKDIHEGPRRTTKGHEGVGENSRGIRQRLGREKRFPPRAIKDLLRGQKMNPGRDSKGLEKTRKGSVKGHEERHEGPLRGWRRLKRDPPKVGKGEKNSTKGMKYPSRG